jgi:hypothetical protein
LKRRKRKSARKAKVAHRVRIGAASRAAEDPMIEEVMDEVSVAETGAVIAVVNSALAVVHVDQASGVAKDHLKSIWTNLSPTVCISTIRRTS